MVYIYLHISRRKCSLTAFWEHHTITIFSRVLVLFKSAVFSVYLLTWRPPTISVFDWQSLFFLICNFIWFSSSFIFAFLSSFLFSLLVLFSFVGLYLATELIKALENFYFIYLFVDFAIFVCSKCTKNSLFWSLVIVNSKSLLKFILFHINSQSLV